MPPSRNAAAFAPFLMKTPAQIPATVPKDNSYRDTADPGGGGGSSSGGGGRVGSFVTIAMIL